MHADAEPKLWRGDSMCAPFVIFMVIFFIAKANPIFAVLQKKLDRVNSVMQENVSGSRVVKAYVREDYEKKRFGTANKELVDTQLRVLVLFSCMMPLMNIVMNLSVVAVIYVGSVQVKSGGATPGNVMAAITYVSQILNGIMMMAMVFQNISRGTASARRLNEVLECEPVIADGKQEIRTDIRGKIEFRDVSFSYPGGNGESVLSHINLTVEPGETLAILGATGSRKVQPGQSDPALLRSRGGDSAGGRRGCEGISA